MTVLLMPGPAASLEASSGLLPPPVPLPSHSAGTEAAAPAIMQQGQAAREPWEVREGTEPGWPPLPPGLSEGGRECAGGLASPQTRKKLDWTHCSNLLTNTFPPPESRCQLIATPGWLPTRPSQAKAPGAGSPGNSGQTLSSRAGEDQRQRMEGWDGLRAAAQGSLGSGRKHHSEALRAVGTQWSRHLRGPEQQADGGSPRQTCVSLAFLLKQSFKLQPSSKTGNSLPGSGPDRRRNSGRRGA